MEGYITSKSWEAWYDSANVLWENSEPFYILCLILSISAIIFSYYYLPPKYCCNIDYSSEDNKQNQRTVIKQYMDSQDDPPMETVEKLLHKIEPELSDEEKEKEQIVMSAQLQKIYELMNKEKDKFGDTSLEDLKDQMKFYSS